MGKRKALKKFILIYLVLAVLILAAVIAYVLWPDNVHPDVRMFDLEGPVIEATIVRVDSLGNSCVTEHVEFDKDGRVTLDPYGNVYNYDSLGAFTDGNHFYTEIVRNDRGSLRNYLDERGGEGRTFDFMPDTDRYLLTVRIEDCNETEKLKYIYDKDHNRTGMERERISGSASGSERYTETYEIVEKDSHGNWIVRNVTVESEIDYVYYDQDGRRADAVATGTERFVDRRDIKYHE